MARPVGFRANVGFNAKFLTQLAAQAALIRLPRFYLATGKLPFQRKGTITPALTNEQPATLLDQASYHGNRGRGMRHTLSPSGKTWLVRATIAGERQKSKRRKPWPTSMRRVGAQGASGL